MCEFLQALLMTYTTCTCTYVCVYIDKWDLSGICLALYYTLVQMNQFDLVREGELLMRVYQVKWFFVMAGEFNGL